MERPRILRPDRSPKRRGVLRPTAGALRPTAGVLRAATGAICTVRILHRCAPVLLVAGLVALPSLATAQPERPSTYERTRTTAVMEREGLTPIEPADAEGRTIAFIRVVREDVFIEEDGGLFGWLTWANIFHTLTRESVVDRELLLQEGRAYSIDRAEETRRNLYSLAIFSYVRVVPVEAPNDEVGVLVYTRDLWSLRLESNFQVTGSTLDNLSLQLSERNVLGLQKRGTVRFFLVPDTFSVGQTYVDRRVANGPVRLSEAIDFIFNRESGDLEGFFGFLSVRSPFYDLAQRWGFAVEGSVLTEIERQFRGGELLTYDIPDTPEEEALPQEWRQREYEASAFLLHRHGERFKQTFGVGFAYDEIDTELLEVEGRTQAQAEAFARDVLPQERRDIGPVLSYDLFLPTFNDYENLAAYGITESVRTGPSVSLQVGFPVSGLGSSTDSVTFEADYGYILGFGDFLLEGSLFGAARLENGNVVNKRLRAELRGATPVVGFARMAFRFRWEGRDNDTNRTLVSLGGDNGLRGFVSQAFFERGGNLLAGNVEIRTLPLEIWSVQLGVVLFYDVGTVYADASDIELHHAVGLGVRAMFPQFNRLPFRFDLGAPVSEGDFSVSPSFGATQAVPLTEFEDNLAL
ncbi:MAG: BamA/TamA family outer membrane protein [Myxococcota bacterium]